MEGIGGKKGMVLKGQQRDPCTDGTILYIDCTGGYVIYTCDITALN